MLVFFFSLSTITLNLRMYLTDYYYLKADLLYKLGRFIQDSCLHVRYQLGVFRPAEFQFLVKVRLHKDILYTVGEITSSSSSAMRKLPPVT